MRFLESWWERAPWYVRIGVTMVSVIAMVLGGSADHYWQ
jgi:hypothetical protein